MNTENILSQVGACLIIEWIETDAENHWDVQYYLRLPLRDFDIRREDNDGEKVRDCLKLSLGGTTIRGRLNLCPDKYENPEVDTPYRDGAHIKWDARILGLPAFAVYKDTISEIKIYTPG